MTNTDIQIKRAFEMEKMTPEQIAEDQDLDVLAVKARLVQLSPQYRRACGAEVGVIDEDEESLNFTNDQLRDVNAVMYNIAMNAEDQRLQFDAAKYIRDDKKGRKEAVKAIQNGPMTNILQFNSILQQVREKTERLKNGAEVNQIVDVAS